MADKYIKLSDLKKKLNYIYRAYGTSKQMRETINVTIGRIPYVVKGELETALETYDTDSDAEPVRHGRWIDSGINGTVSCSLCKFTDFFAKQNRVMLFKYCPGCGAKMEGREQ